MKDWLDEEMEREGLVRHRSEEARLREERAAYAGGNDRLRLKWHTQDAEELKLTHARNCDARAVKEEHARAHARINHEGSVPKKSRFPILSIIVLVWVMLSAITALIPTHL